MSAKRLTHEERAKIYRLWKEEGLTYRTIAERCGVNPATVGNVVKKMNGTPRKSQINEEFDNAVNQMIEESKPQEIVQTDKPVIMTEEHTAAIPDAVIEALREQIKSDELYVESNLSSIRELQQENEQYRTKIAALKKWLAEVSA